MIFYHHTGRNYVLIVWRHLSLWLPLRSRHCWSHRFAGQAGMDVVKGLQCSQRTRPPSHWNGCGQTWRQQAGGALCLGGAPSPSRTPPSGVSSCTSCQTSTHLQGEGISYYSQRACRILYELEVREIPAVGRKVELDRLCEL